MQPDISAEERALMQKRMMQKDNMGVDGLKIENGKIIKELDNDELEMMKIRLKERIEMMTREITNKEREIVDAKERIKLYKEKEIELNAIIEKAKKLK